MLSPTSTAPVAPVCIIMLHYHESKHWTDYFFILYTIYYIRYQYYIYTSYDMIYIYISYHILSTASAATPTYIIKL